MRRILLTVVLLAIAILLAASRPTAAQTDKPTCDPATVIKKAADLKPSGDQKKDMDALLALVLQPQIGA